MLPHLRNSLPNKQWAPYEKYLPASEGDEQMPAALWSDVIGHETVKQQIERVLSRRAVPHALLFCGPEAVGKATLALAFAARLLTAEDTEATAAEKLRLLRSGNYPDLHWVRRAEGKKEITVEAVRTLCSALRLKPYYSGCSVAIIDNAHEMSIAAANALLMTLEEPGRNSYLLLVTHAPQRLPATIVSRCQALHCGELATEEISEILRTRILSSSEHSATPSSPQPLAAGLQALCSGSLAGLNLSPFVRPVTLELNTSTESRTHIESLAAKAARLHTDFEDFFSRAEEGSATSQRALSLASALAADSDDLSLAWRLLNQALRERLRRAAPPQKSRWADVLECSLAAEKQSSERNANPQLQLSSLFLRAAAEDIDQSLETAL
jgi:hypothetical protein